MARPDDQLIQKSIGLPVAHVTEVVDFVDFHARRDGDTDRHLAHAAAASEPPFAKVRDVYHRM